MTLHLFVRMHSGTSADYDRHVASLRADPGVRLHDDLAQFLTQPAEQRIAVVEVNYHDWHNDTTPLLARLSGCRSVIVRSMENHPDIERLAQQFDLDNFTWFMPGSPALTLARHVPNFEWLTSTHYHYFHDAEFLATGWRERTRPDQERDHAFDIMLGVPKPHREFCRQWVRDNVSNGHYLMSPPMTRGTRFDQLPLDSVFREPEMSTSPEAHTVTYLGQTLHQATVLPIRLYERTQHSVVCETSTEVCFPTEKTCKPIMAQRLFVVLSCRGYLRHLRDIGFHTFGHIIDESYDNEPDDRVRWRMALEQMHTLTATPLGDLWPRLRPTVEHNLHILRSLPVQGLLHSLEQAIAAPE